MHAYDGGVPPLSFLLRSTLQKVSTDGQSAVGSVSIHGRHHDDHLHRHGHAPPFSQHPSFKWRDVHRRGGDLLRRATAQNYKTPRPHDHHHRDDAPSPHALPHRGGGGLPLRPPPRHDGGAPLLPRGGAPPRGDAAPLVRVVGLY